MQAERPSSHGTLSFTQTMLADGDASFRVWSATPDMVNGDASTFEFIFIGSGLSKVFHWMPDRISKQLTKVTTTETLKARVVTEALFHRWLLIDDGLTVLKANIHALVLAAGRVTIRRAWGITESDIVGTQLMTVPGTFPINVSGVATGDCSPFGTQVEWNAAHTVLSALYDTHMNGFLALVQQVSTGMPPCNGCTIVRTMVHHYQDPNKAICDSGYNQFITETAPLPNGLIDVESRDLICHKMAHPISSPKLVWMARSPAVKANLKALGFGAAAVRLPAEFDVERGAGSIVALVHRAARAGTNANLVVRETSAELMLTFVRQTIEDNPGHAGLKLADDHVDAYMDTWGYDMAFLGGFLHGMFEFMSAAPRLRSVLNGYKVSKLQEAYPEAWAAGIEHYDLARKWRRERARDGNLCGFGLLGEAKPDDYVTPEN